MCCVLHFLKYIITEAPPAWLTGSAVASKGTVAEPPYYQHLAVYTHYKWKDDSFAGLFEVKSEMVL